MNIFESLENLNVSEECFDDLLYIIESYINELKDETVQSMLDKRHQRAEQAYNDYHYSGSDSESDEKNKYEKRQLTKREERRAKRAAWLRDFRKGTGDQRPEFHDSLKNDWKYYQGKVTRWKGKTSNDLKQKKRGLELLNQAHPDSPIYKRQLKHVNKELERKSEG